MKTRLLKTRLGSLNDVARSERPYGRAAGICPIIPRRLRDLGWRKYGLACHPYIYGALFQRRTYSGLWIRPGGNPGTNLSSISYRYHLILVAFVWELNKETINLPLGCLQGGMPLPCRSAATAFKTCVWAPTRWSSQGSFPLSFRVLRDQICTTFGPKVDYVVQVDFR